MNRPRYERAESSGSHVRAPFQHELPRVVGRGPAYLFGAAVSCSPLENPDTSGKGKKKEEIKENFRKINFGKDVTDF